MPGGLSESRSMVQVAGGDGMIWEWLVGFVADAAEWLGAQLAALVPPVPDWLAGVGAQIAVVVDVVAAGGMWFPVELLAPILIAIVAAWVAGVSIKIVRIIASFLTLGGGGAG